MSPTRVLPETVGRLLTADDRALPMSWLVQDLVPARGLTAIAISDAKVRTAIGVTLLRALLDRQRQQRVLGCAPARGIQSALVIASTKRTGQEYLDTALEHEGVTVVAAEPWQLGDDSYWPALHKLAADVELVVVDAANELTNGNPTIHLSLGLRGFVPPVVGMYVGAATQPGVGGDVAWSGAEGRFWLDQKAGKLRSIDDPDREPWAVTVVETPSLPTEADRVRRTAELARRHHVMGGRHFDALNALEICAHVEMAAIWGPEPSHVAIAAAIARQPAAWAPPPVSQQADPNEQPPF